MSNRYVRELLRVYDRLVKDVLYAYPSMNLDLSKDLSRLTRLTEQRGLPFLMVDLPALSKHLDRCLAEGQYKVSGLPGASRVSRTIPIPKLFRGLYLLIFESDGRLKEHIDDQALLLLRQLLLVAKKAKVECTLEATRETVRRFIDTDDSLPEPGPYWSNTEALASEEMGFTGFTSDPHFLARCSDRLLQVDYQRLLSTLDIVSSLLSIDLGVYEPLDWCFRHGPGVVSNLRTGEDRYRFASWSERLETVFPYCDCAFHNLASWAANPQPARHDESLSKLAAVPKTLSKPRLIASEPQENMWCQQNMRDYMYTRTRRSVLSNFVRFNDQSLNQQLARRGSVDGSLATLDLSDASDRVSCRCVGQFFRSNLSLLRGLRASRTRCLSIPSSLLGEERVIELRKYSTMGNATTFPVESLIFLGIALAGCFYIDGYQPKTIDEFKAYAGKVSIFGDDIIVPVECASVVMCLLEILDFKVNSSKTYLTGRFRESCGVECFAGIDVSPAYWHGFYNGTPESYSSIVETANNLYKRFMVETSRYLGSTIEGFRTPLIAMDSGVLGFKTFVSPSECHNSFKRRWNSDLQIAEAWIPVLSGRSELSPMNNDSALLQFFTEQPDPQTMWESGVRGRPVLKLRHRYVDCATFERSAAGDSSNLRITAPRPPKFGWSWPEDWGWETDFSGGLPVLNCT